MDDPYAVRATSANDPQMHPNRIQTDFSGQRAMTDAEIIAARAVPRTLHYIPGERQAIPALTLTTQEHLDILKNEREKAKKEGFALAIDVIEILARRYLGPNHEVMEKIKNLKA